jgi:hypothetical protein
MGGRTTDDELVSRVRALRDAGATYVQIKAELGIGASTISRILGTYGQGRRPRVSQATKEKAASLRRDGLSVPEIARELGIAKSTAWLITKGISWELTPDRAERNAMAARASWQERNRQADIAEQRDKFDWARRAGDISDRELLLIGAAIYWAEGAKSKPWRRNENLIFTNSDPLMISLFLRWLDLLDVSHERRTFRVQIHETADVQAALRYWSDVVGVPVETFMPTTLKRHKPRTTRRNVGEDYRGCLVVRVRRSVAEYRAAEGLWVGAALSVQRRTADSVTGGAAGNLARVSGAAN